jgi:hypothetical protein
MSSRLPTVKFMVPGCGKAATQVRRACGVNDSCCYIVDVNVLGIRRMVVARRFLLNTYAYRTRRREGSKFPPTRDWEVLVT